MLKNQPTILQLIPALETGGAERGCVDMAAAIQAGGGRALVISAGGQMVDELKKSGAQHIEWPSIKSKNPFVIIGNALKLKALVQAEKVALIHARSRAPAWVGYLAAKWAGVPFLTTFHSTYNFKSAAKRFYNSVMVRGAWVIAISGFIHSHIIQHYPEVPEANIRLIHRGIDLSAFTPANVGSHRVAEMRASWHVPEDACVILLPGRLTRWKGQGVLIEAMARLRGTGCVAVFVGSDQGRSEYRRELDNLIAHCGVQHCVRIAGDCTDMPAAYAAADIVVSASTEPEAFGRVIVEAQAMGKPVVVSNLGAVAETAGATGFGWIVPPANPAALAAAIRDIMGMDEDEKAQRAAHARDYINANYSRTLMCEKTLAVYAELLS